MAANLVWAICERGAEMSFTRKSFLPKVAAAALLTWCLSGGVSAAEVGVSGTPERVVLTTNDATMADIIAAFRSAFDVEVHLTGGTARKYSGVYSGSVRQVLSRLLTGSDYILSSDPDGISIRLLGNSAAASSAAPSRLPLTAPGSRQNSQPQGQVKR
jgi:hypothetical protein